MFMILAHGNHAEHAFSIHPLLGVALAAGVVFFMVYYRKSLNSSKRSGK